MKNTAAKSAITPLLAVAMPTMLLLLLNRGNFAINDDWIFARQVEAFLAGNITLSVLIDPSFIIQDILGSAWAKLFGASFVSLRFLTIVMYVVSVLGVYKILQMLKTPVIVTAIALATLAVNPLIFTSALTFMTEIYFLCFFVWSIYFFLQRKWLFVGATIGLSLLVRQTGVVAYIAVLLFLVMEALRIKNWKNSLVSAVFVTVPVVAAFFVYAVWPRYTQDGTLDGVSNLLANVGGLGGLSERLRLLVYSLPYFGFFASPLLFAKKRQLPKIWVALLLMLSAGLSIYLYKVDVFAPGSVFYIEGIHAKSNFRHALTIFDNTLFKLPFALFVSATVVLLVYDFVNNIKKFLTNTPLQFLGLLLLGSFFINLFGTDFYDRYLIVSIVCVVLILTVLYLEENLRLKWALTSLVLLAAMTLFHQIDFMSSTKAVWEQAGKISQQTGLVTGIMSDDVYAKYFNAKKQNDYTGLISTMPAGGNYKCYVQQYSQDTQSPVLASLTMINDALERKFENPRIYESKKRDGIPRVTKHLGELLYNQEYFSPAYNLVGRKAFVGSWCTTGEN